MMKNKYFIVLILFLFFFIKTHCQSQPVEYSVLFYNVENLFDLMDDPETGDEEFTPEGDRRWTYKRFNNKIHNLSKVILSAAGWEPPQVVALCEVENRYVLECLINKTALQRYPYRIIHKESPDERGIDVAMLYNKDVFYPLDYQYIPLKTKCDSIIKTREILCVSGIMGGLDTLHFFVNHWPSRYGGLMETQSLRNRAAETLRHLFEKKMNNNSQSKVIILGDFNDQPDDESLSDYLGALEISDCRDPADIINLSFPWKDASTGTIKYQSQWSVFDQIMVSYPLLSIRKGLFTEPGLAQIVKLPFLLEKDKRYGGYRTSRTYVGYKYQDGFSDHLPVLLKFKTVN